MRKSALATFITTLTLVAVTIVSACSPDRPDEGRRTAVPNDMPGARNSASVTSSADAIRITYPHPGAVLTNTVTVQGIGDVDGAEYYVGIASGGRYLAEGTIAREPNGGTGVFSYTLTFEPVAAPSDGEVTVFTTSPDTGSVDRQAVVPVRLAPASARALYGPSIHLSPESGKAGTPVVIVGEGFPPNSSVEVRLSGISTEATEQAYVHGQSGTGGDFRLSLTMPAFWPNGDPITGPQVLVVASTPDFVNKASAVFGYGSAVAPESGTPLPGERQPAARMAEEFLRAWSAGSSVDALGYLSPDYRNVVAAEGITGEEIARVLGNQGTPGPASIAVIDASPLETVVRATLSGGNGPHKADITLAEAGDGWKIVHIAAAADSMQ